MADTSFAAWEPYWLPPLKTVFHRGSPYCIVCSRKPEHRQKYLCDSCHRILGAPGEAVAKLRAMCSQWDPDIQAFRCYYTRVPLVGPKNAYDAPTWEHDAPFLVLDALLVNRMKFTLTDPEFREMLGALIGRFDGQAFDQAAFPNRPVTTAAPEDALSVRGAPPPPPLGLLAVANGAPDANREQEEP